MCGSKVVSLSAQELTALLNAGGAKVDGPASSTGDNLVRVIGSLQQLAPVAAKRRGCEGGVGGSAGAIVTLGADDGLCHHDAIHGSGEVTGHQDCRKQMCRQMHISRVTWLPSCTAENDSGFLSWQLLCRLHESFGFQPRAQ